MPACPLFDAYPRLRTALPVAGLLVEATPVQAVDAERKWYLKRDDLSAADYGGNKIRKLDFLLAEAKARGARDILTFGYAGSNFVAATAWHGRKLGLHTIAYLLPQVNAEYVARNLSVGLASGAELRLLNGTPQIACAATLRSLRAVFRDHSWPMWIPPGGSSPLGAVGFVNAAFELRAQIETGVLPAPDVIHVAFSSMGTVAGLALGLELAGLQPRIMAVQVVDGRFASRAKLKTLIHRTSDFLRHKDPAIPNVTEQAVARVEIRNEFFGGEYARPTSGTSAAMQRFASQTGACADSAYTGKALACFYHDMDSGYLDGKTALYWHSFNARGLPPGAGIPAAEAVAPELGSYFET